MSFSIEVNHDLHFVHYRHSGVIERKDIGEAWQSLLNLKEFREEGYHLLSDYRGGEFSFSVEELDVVERFLESIKHILHGKKNAVIVEGPNEAVIALLFENKKSQEIEFHVETFSTLAGALNFIKSSA